MRLALRCARKDLLRMVRDPLGLGVWLGMPVLIGLVLVALFGREAPRPQGVLFVADLDGTFLSSFVTRAYTEGELGEMITVRRTPLEEGRRRIAKGEGSALLVIPKGFADAVLTGGAAKLELVTNPSQAILPRLVEEITELLVDGAWYLQRVIGEDLRPFSEIGGRPADALIAAFSIRTAHLIDQYWTYVNPPAIDVEIKSAEADPQAGIRMSLLMLPSMTFMAVVFLAFGYSGDVWREKLQGTLRRTATTPVSMAEWLGGKLLALGVLLGCIGVASLLVAKFLLEAPVQNGAVAVGWILVTGCGLYLGMLLLHTSAGDVRSAHVTANIAVMTLAMLGGTFFPFEIMPASLARIGRSTPNGWALVKWRAMLEGSAGMGAMVAWFALAGAAAALLFWLASRRLRRRFLLQGGDG